MGLVLADAQIQIGGTELLAVLLQILDLQTRGAAVYESTHVFCASAAHRDQRCCTLHLCFTSLVFAGMLFGSEVHPME